MFVIRLLASVAVSTAYIATAYAESHTVTLTNKCDQGTPLLKALAGGQTLSTGESYETNGPLMAAIAYLDTGSCGPNGENCTLVELTLVNPISPGTGSTADISLIPPHTFSVASGFEFFGGCDGVGVDCPEPGCPGAFRSPTDGIVTVCQADNVNLAVTFCS